MNTVKQPISRKDVWLIPKRSNIYQIIGIVEILVNDGHDGKIWNHSKQESVATKMRFRNLTMGRNFSGQSVRTLFANGPKFLGFAYTDSDQQEGTSLGNKVLITKAGHKLAGEDLLNGDKIFYNLSEWEKGHSIIGSKLLKLQLIKLVLNNPITHNGGKALVFPFLAALKLCKRLGYIDVEELAYILFSMQEEDQIDLIERRILNFRCLPANNRKLEIDAYSRTEAGKLTLVKAPSANYFMNFCSWSGIFRKTKHTIQGGRVLSSIELLDTAYADELCRIIDGHIYDFHNNKKLWIDYYGDPDKIKPPRDITLNIEVSSPGAYFVEIQADNIIVDSLIIEGQKCTKPITVFEGGKYSAHINYLTSNKVVVKEFEVDDKIDEINVYFEIPMDRESGIQATLDTAQGAFDAIKELAISNNGYDKSFYDLLKLRKKLEGKDYINNRTKGGRLEYLFYRMLTILYEEGRIDYVKWYGKLSENGIPGPAPGGKNGNPDIVFEIDDISVVIELTTIRGTAAQWTSSEAASVPDHIKRYAEQNYASRTVGIFSAPYINSRVESNFKSQASLYGTSICCVTLEDFASLLMKTRDDIKSFLVNKL